MTPQDPTPPTPAAPRRRAFSLEGRLAGVLALAVTTFAGLTAAGVLLALPFWPTLLLAYALTLPVVVWGARAVNRPVRRTLAALSDGIRSFRDRDFGVRIPSTRTDELGDLARLYNTVGQILHEERSQLRQRELLLQAALDHSPVAIVLVSPLDRVVYANHEARRLFLGGGRLVGLRFSEIVQDAPAELRQVLDAGQDGIFSVARPEAQTETYHLSHRRFRVNRRPHHLLLLRRMTAELARQEAEIWKKVIRIISHELNNSLAPIGSLAHSGGLIARGDPAPDHVERLETIFAAIRERTRHLAGFLEGYARYARLPRPKKQDVDWATWLAGPRRLHSFELIGELPELPGHFDPAQLEQVLINLLKNATEASDGEPQIAVVIQRPPDGGVRVQVLDRGRGMSEEVMRQSLLPFYSTKPSGTGVGLPLCREIVEAHGGTLRLQARPGGGTIVSFWLP